MLYKEFEKIITKNLEYTFEADIAVYIMIFSVVVNYIVAKYLLKKGHQTDSNALLGDGYHLMSDVYSSLAVAIGLLAVKFSGHYILDPVIAIIVAVMILKTGIGLIRKTGDNLLDFVAVDDVKKLRIPPAFIKLMKGKILEQNFTAFERCEHVEILPEKPLMLQVDGELYENLPFVVDIVKDTLRMFRA